MVILSAGIRSLLGKPRSGPESGQQRHLSPGRIHHGMGGRHHLGTVGGIISEWRAASFRNRGRLRPESAAGPVAGLVGIEGGVVSGVINLESPALKRRPGDNAMKNVTST